jgi:hypothetical protein
LRDFIGGLRVVAELLRDVLFLPGAASFFCAGFFT